MEQPQVGAEDYLFSENVLHDCHFLVGPVDGDVQPEKFGAVKAMLLAHSPVFRMMLEESGLREDTRNVIHLPDVQPDAFKLVLKYVYNTLEDPLYLSRDMALKLFYVANKYLIEPLRQKAISQLIPRSAEEVFPALHCITLYITGVDVLEKIVKSVVQTSTSQIFRCPQFLSINRDCLVYILKQPTLNCQEVEIWKASVEWAAHQGQSNEGPILRKFLKKPLKHIRFFTMDTEEIFKAVSPTNILTDAEMTIILRAIVKSELKFSESNPPKFCCSSVLRNLTDPKIIPKYYPKYYSSLSHWMNIGYEKRSSCLIAVGKNRLTLRSLTCRGKDSPFMDIDYITGTKIYRCVCKMILSVYKENVLEEVCIINFEEEVKYEEEFVILTMYQGSYLNLTKHHIYSIDLEFSEPHPVWSSMKYEDEPQCNKHLLNGGWLCCDNKPNHIIHLHYT